MNWSCRRSGQRSSALRVNTVIGQRNTTLDDKSGWESPLVLSAPSHPAVLRPEELSQVTCSLLQLRKNKTQPKENPENTHRPQLYDERHLILLILFFLSCNVYLLHKILPSAFHLITYSLCCACCLPSHTSSTKYSIFKFRGLCWSSYKAPKPERVATQQENKGAELLLTSRNTELLELNTQARTGFG